VTTTDISLYKTSKNGAGMDFNSSTSWNLKMVYGDSVSITYTWADGSTTTETITPEQGEEVLSRIIHKTYGEGTINVPNPIEAAEEGA